MMSKSRSCMFPLLSAVTGLLSVSGAGNNVKYVCQGDSVQAFQNIEFNHSNAYVSLIIPNDVRGHIAVWSIQNGIRNEDLKPEYQGRLIFDQNGTITIKNFDESDEAKYVVNSRMDPLPKIYQEQLSLMAAPTKDCKPMIKQLGNRLIASLKANVCGKPVSELYWEDYDGDSNTNGLIIKLTPGMEARTYRACIKGDALKCVKNVTSQNYCSTFTPEGKEEHQSEVKVTEKSPPISSETINANEHITVCIILIIVFLLAMVALPVIFFLYRRRKKNVNDEQIGKLKWKDFRKLLNDDQQKGLLQHRDSLKLQMNNPTPNRETTV